MFSVLPVLILALSINLSEGKLFEKCELANELIDFHGATLEDAEKFVCIAELSSQFDSAYSEETSFGIFNITKDACEKGAFGGSCDETCESFMDDFIRNDFECAKKSEMLYDSLCENNAVPYLDDCGLTSLTVQEQNDEVYDPNLTTPEEPEEVDVQENSPIDQEDSDNQDVLNQPEIQKENEEENKQGNQPINQPNDLRAIEIEEYSGKENFNIEQINLMRQLMNDNPKRNAKFIFVFV